MKKGVFALLIVVVVYIASFFIALAFCATPTTELSNNTQNINIVLPSDCRLILSASDGKQGLLVTYLSMVGDKTRAALYPNANDGDRPSFIFTFVKE